MTSPIMSCEVERNFSKLSTIKTNNQTKTTKQKNLLVNCAGEKAKLSSYFL